MATAKQAIVVQQQQQGVVGSARTTLVQGFETIQMGMSIIHRSCSLVDTELKNLQVMQQIRLVSEQAELNTKCKKLGIEMPVF
jgi:hypothetical protein